MLRSTTIAVLTLLSAMSGHAAEAQSKFSCSGSIIEPASLTSSPMNVQLTLITPKKVVLNLGQGDGDARIVSDNKIQLKFQTKDFTGEFFHYTNDLFLIYKSGHLARLTCNPA
jgi:hypothetical protein